MPAKESDSEDKERTAAIHINMDKETRKSTITLSKQRAAAVLMLFAVALIAVGLLAGLVRPSCTAVPSSLTTAAPPRPPEGGIDEPWKNHRLPLHLVPVHYDLTLNPDFYQSDGSPGLFTGNVSIWFNVTGTRSSRHFLIHIKWLSIGRTSARYCGRGATTCNGAESLAISRTFEYPENEYLVVEMERPVETGSTVVVDIQFSGSLTKGINGLYRSRYTDSRTGETR